MIPFLRNQVGGAVTFRYETFERTFSVVSCRIFCSENDASRPGDKRSQASYLSRKFSRITNRILTKQSVATDMPLSSTVVGSFPKPSYLNIPDWFNPTCSKDFSEKYTLFMQNSTASEMEELISRAIKETAQIQAEAGIDVISDGELRRENYVYHFCRKLKNLDFHNLCSKCIRCDAATILVPRVVGEVSAQEDQPWVWKKWKNSQDLFKELPVKVTLPGPMTVADSVVDQYYNDDKILGSVLSKIINKEIKALVLAGCKYIQVSHGGCEVSFTGHSYRPQRGEGGTLDFK